MKRAQVLGLLALVVCVAAFTSVLTTSRVHLIGPYFTSATRWDSATAQQAGGQVVYANASDSEKIGDVVYYSASNTTAKSGTLANYNAIAGIVVGGKRTTMQGSTASADVGTLAATANQPVIILKRGRVWAKADTTTGGIAVGTVVIPSPVAGNVVAKTTAIDSAGRSIGKVVTTCAASSACLLDANVRY